MKKNIICLLGLALLVTGCAKKSKPVSNSASITPTSDSVVAPTSNESSAPVATSSSQSASISTSVAPSKTYTVVSEGTYEEADGVITLKTAEQKYSFSGSYNGGIVIPEDVTKITIEFNGFTLRPADAKGIDYIPESSKVVLDLKAGTENFIYTANKTAVSSNNNVELCGTGKLVIQTGNNGFSCSNFTTTGGKPIVELETTKDAIKAKQISITHGEFKFTNGETAIKAELNSKGAKGTLAIGGEAKVSVTGTKVALSGATSITVSDTAVIDIKTVENAVVTPAYTCAETASVKVDNVNYVHAA